MPNPANVTVIATADPRTDTGPADVAELVRQVNNLTASLRLLTAKLDNDAGVTDTTYRSLISDSGVATAPATIQYR